MTTPTPYLCYDASLPLWDAQGKFIPENYWSQPVFFCHADGTVFDSNEEMLDAHIAWEERKSCTHCTH